jgi:alkanesulfonate monooxygenase SsuD/methylene tetrahydromethanopterin reductase-like flavin-dependent oxidoreductase (luciferase family)
VQHPHPPIIVGGSGKRGTLEPALRFADEYNVTFAPPEDVARLKREVGDRLPVSLMIGFVVGATRDEALDRARQLYERVPRDVDFDTWLERYSAHSLVGSVDEVAARLREYERAGAERVMLQHLLHADLEPVRLIGERLGSA